MPYYVTIDATWAHDVYSQAYDSRKDAHTALQRLRPAFPDDKLVIRFLPLPIEKDGWRVREQGRFRNKTYLSVPWADDHSRYAVHYRYYVAPEHYVHLSVSHPDLVAYTPDEEYGVQDRQIRLTPARYLQRFIPELPAERVQKYVATVQALSKTLQVSTDPDIIEQIYRNGPSSCMDGQHSFPDTKGTHPSRVYGEPGDLGVAYIGNPETGVSARAVIWPAEKTYNRIYGYEDMLRYLLQQAGYRETGYFDGARIRAIVVGRPRDHVYVMPYIDAANGATLESPFFVLSDSDGDYGVKETNGVTGEVSYSTCEHCETRIAEDESLCDSCQEQQYSCDDCEEYYFRDSDGSVRVGQNRYCPNCAKSHQQICETCANTWYEENLSRTLQQERQRRHVTAYCEACSADHEQCQHCSELFTYGENPCPHCAHAVRCEHTADLLSRGLPLPKILYREVAGSANISLQDAWRDGQWATLLGENARCRISICRGEIPAGTPAYVYTFSDTPGTLAYCQNCMKAYANHNSPASILSRQLAQTAVTALETAHAYTNCAST